MLRDLNKLAGRGPGGARAGGRSSCATDAQTTFAPDGRVTLPSREAVIGVVEDLRAVLFPGYFGTSDLHDESLHYFVGATLARALRSLEEQICRGLAFTERHELQTCVHCCDRSPPPSTKAFLGAPPRDPAALRLRRGGGLRGRPGR